MSISPLDLGLLAYSIIFLLSRAYGWYQTSRVFESIPAEVIWRIALFSLSARGWHRLAFTLATWIATLALLVRVEDLPVHLGLVSIAFVATLLGMTIRYAQPPIALLLTESSRYTGRLLRRLNRVLFPYRTVALLRYADASLHGFGSSQNLRTRDYALWQSIVYNLIDICPLAILDTRGENEAVTEEAFIMTAPQRISKAILIIGSAGQSPTLSALGLSPADHMLPCVTEHDLVENVWRRVQSRNITVRLPQPSKPMLRRDLHSVPSVLFIFIRHSFDSAEIVAEAAGDKKDVLGVLLPGPELSSHDARLLREFCWHFAHDPKLAIIVLEPRPILLIRTSALLAIATRLGSHHGERPPGRLTIEQLFDIDPVAQAYGQFLAALKQRCLESGLTYRVTRLPWRLGSVPA